MIMHRTAVMLQSVCETLGYQKVARVQKISVCPTSANRVSFFNSSVV